MLKLIDGASQRRVYGSGQCLDREMHAAFTQVEGRDGTVPSEAIYDIRRWRQYPWRKLGKRIVEMHAAGTTIDQAKRIVRVLDLFIDRLYNSTGGNAA